MWRGARWGERGSELAQRTGDAGVTHRRGRAGGGGMAASGLLGFIWLQTHLTPSGDNTESVAVWCSRFLYFRLEELGEALGR